MAIFLLLAALFAVGGSQFQDLHKVCKDSNYAAEECKVHKKLEDLNEKHK